MMRNSQPLIFSRPVWWYLFSGLMLLLTGGACLFLLHLGVSDKPGAAPMLSVIGPLLVLGGIGFFGFRCRTVIDFADNRVTYEWKTFFIRHQAVYPLSDIRAVGVRRAELAGGTTVRTHHVFLAIDKAGQSVQVELQEIVYHEEAVDCGREVARVLGKPFVDCSDTGGMG